MLRSMHIYAFSQQIIFAHPFSPLSKRGLAHRLLASSGHGRFVTIALGYALLVPSYISPPSSFVSYRAVWASIGSISLNELIQYLEVGRN